jgi:hypothetical protein
VTLSLPSQRRSPSAAFLSLFVSIVAAMICFLITRTSLNLFLGSILLAAILTPALCTKSERIPITVLAITIGFAIVWLLALGSISLITWIKCVLILASFVAAMAYAVELLRSCRVHPTAASAIVTIASLAWLTWPIWFNGSGPVTIHPIFAMNSACREMGIWTEQNIAYHLTSLGQDIAYRLPSSVAPMVFTHCTIAFMFDRIKQKISHR